MALAASVPSRPDARALASYSQCSQQASRPSRTAPGFFRDGRAGLWESGFPKKKVAPGLGDLEASDFLTLTLMPFLQINVRVDTRDFRWWDHVA